MGITLKARPIATEDLLQVVLDVITLLHCAWNGPYLGTVAIRRRLSKELKYGVGCDVSRRHDKHVRLDVFVPRLRTKLNNTIDLVPQGRTGIYKLLNVKEVSSF